VCPDAVRQARIERGLSQRELATAAGVSIRTVVRAERTHVSPLAARAIAQALGVAPGACTCEAPNP
jgi:transcriptional regulator with XRE-family HTH domain